MTKRALEVRLLLLASILAMKAYPSHTQSHSVPYEEQRERIEKNLDEIEEGKLGRLWWMLDDKAGYSGVFRPSSRKEAQNIASDEQIMTYVEYSQRPENAHLAAWEASLSIPLCAFSSTR